MIAPADLNDLASGLIFDGVDRSSTGRKTTSTIYILVDPTTDEIRYIGKTQRSLNARWRSHCRDRDDTYKARWIRSLIARGYAPLIFPLEVVPVEEANDRERYWIARHKKHRIHRLTNLTDGGEGTRGWNPGASWRAASSARMIGKSHSVGTEARMRIGEAARGNAYSLGRKRSQEENDRISASMRASWSTRQRTQKQILAFEELQRLRSTNPAKFARTRDASGRFNG